MSCISCGGKSKQTAPTYYQNKFASAKHVPVKTEKVVEQKKNCEVTQKMLVQLLNMVNRSKGKLPSEEYELFISQIGEWNLQRQKRCLELDKYKSLFDKLQSYGTDTVSE